MSLPAGEPALFSLACDRPWAEQVALEMRLPLAPLEERDFEDGEFKLRPLASVRGRHAVVLQSLHGDRTRGVEQKLCRLLFLIACLRDASAAAVTAVVPYLAFSRKDRRTQPRDPVTTRYLATLFEAAGTDRVVTLDVHNVAAFQNAFRCRTEHLEAAGLFAGHFAAAAGGQPLVVVSPDPGGVHRAESLRRRLEARCGQPVGFAMAEKHRALGVVSGSLLAGEVAGRCAIVVDDLVATGGTLARTAALCREHGAAAVHVAATHGLFVGQAAQLLAAPGIDSLVITDSVPPFRLPEGAARARLVVLPTASLVAQAVRRIHDGGSLVELLEHAT